MKMSRPSMAIAIALALMLTTASFAQTIPFVIAGSGDIPGGWLPLAPGISVDHNTQAGWGIKLGSHTGEGGFELVAPPDLANLTADFASSRAYHFTSSAHPGDVLACNYGITTGELPAAEPGRATFYSIDNGADANTPFDDTFIITFWAEFRPALDECQGKFASSRLKSGSFKMLAISGPVNIDAAKGIVVSADSTSGNLVPIPYSWYGAGTLKFNWPYGWF